MRVRDLPLGGHKTLRRQTVPNFCNCETSGDETASSLVRSIKHSRALGRISLREAATQPTSDGALMLRAARNAWEK